MELAMQHEKFHILKNKMISKQKKKRKKSIVHHTWSVNSPKFFSSNPPAKQMFANWFAFEICMG